MDDGNIVDSGDVQIESWVSHSDKNQTLGVADAAYQLLPNAEFTLLNSYNTLSGVGDSVYGQMKYQWLAGDNSAITSSAVLGVNHDISARQFGGIYAYVPTSFTATDWLDINLDLGWQYASVEHRNLFTWGVGGQFHLTDKLSLIEETFGNNASQPGLQSGVHYEFSKTVQLDAIYGRAITGTPGNWVTVGATFTF